MYHFFYFEGETKLRCCDCSIGKLHSFDATFDLLVESIFAS